MDIEFHGVGGGGGNLLKKLAQALTFKEKLLI